MARRIMEEERKMYEEGDNDPNSYTAAWNAGWYYQPPDNEN